jgi:sec-independent protein translocase protein TatA
MFDFSPIQIIIVLVIALAVFGPKKLPEMGRSLGRSLREFKGSISGDSAARDERDAEQDDVRPAGSPLLTKTAHTPVTAKDDDEADEVLVGATPATSARA